MTERKSYVCEKLGQTLNFLPDRIAFCSAYAEGAGIEYTNNEAFNINKITNAEKKYINELKYGRIPKQCQGCIDYKEQKYKNIFEFLFSKPKSTIVKEIIVNHFTQCNCSCIYCSQKKIYGEDAIQKYELLPIIKDLYKNNAIDKKELRVDFQGGDVAVLGEFEPLVKEFIYNGVGRLIISTNGIKYLPIIEEAVRRTMVELHISLDCGTREAFEKIKNVDAFEQVIKNIKEFSIKTNAIIDLKYIIIKGMNDNKWEVSKFLETVKELRCVNSISFDIDFRDIFWEGKKDFNVPEHYKELIKQAQDFCDENRLNLFVAPLAKKYIGSVDKV